MILRLLSEHVKAQNWFAVGLDFLIVVLGVFIGLQVSTWNEARSLEKAQAQLLQRIESDLRLSRDAVLKDIEEAEKIHAGWVYAFRALEACEADMEHRDAINLALAQYQRAFPIEIQRSAFDEMKSTGNFSRLQNVDLQNKLTTLYAMIETDQSGQTGARTHHLATSRIMWKSIAFSFASDDPYDAGYDYDAWATAAFDPKEHCDDLELRGAIWEMVDINRDYLFMAGQYVAAIDDILPNLEEAR